MARIQLNGSTVVLEGFLKSTLYSTAMLVGPAAMGMQPPSAPVLHAIEVQHVVQVLVDKQKSVTALPRQQGKIVSMPCGLFHLRLLPESRQLL